MISRYTLPDMGRIWSDQNKFQQWLEVELAASEALAERGVVPAEAARLLRAHAAFDVARISRSSVKLSTMSSRLPLPSRKSWPPPGMPKPRAGCTTG